MPSASWCFLHVFYIAGNQYQTESKCSETFWRFFWTRRHPVGWRGAWGCPEGSTTHQGAPGGPGAPWWVVPTSVAFRTALWPTPSVNFYKVVFTEVVFTISSMSYAYVHFCLWSRKVIFIQIMGCSSFVWTLEWAADLIKWVASFFNRLDTCLCVATGSNIFYLKIIS